MMFKMQNPYNNFSIIFNRAEDNYMRNGLTDWTGASITLFDNDGTPEMNSNSIPLHPGMVTKIGVKRRTYRTVYHKEPYISKCTDTWEKPFPFSQLLPYTPSRCHRAVFDTPVKEKCNCQFFS